MNKIKNFTVTLEIIKRKDNKIVFNILFNNTGEIRQKTRSSEWLFKRVFQDELRTYHKYSENLILDKLSIIKYNNKEETKKTSENEEIIRLKKCVKTSNCIECPCSSIDSYKYLSCNITDGGEWLSDMVLHNKFKLDDCPLELNT